MNNQAKTLKGGGATAAPAPPQKARAVLGAHNRQ